METVSIPSKRGLHPDLNEGGITRIVKMVSQSPQNGAFIPTIDRRERWNRNQVVSIPSKRGLHPDEESQKTLQLWRTVSIPSKRGLHPDECN